MNKGICTRMLLTNMALEKQALGGGGQTPPPTDSRDPETKQTESKQLEWIQVSQQIGGPVTRAVGSELPQRVVQLVPSWGGPWGLNSSPGCMHQAAQPGDPRKGCLFPIHTKVPYGYKAGVWSKRGKRLSWPETTEAGTSGVWTVNLNIIPKFSGLSYSTPPPPLFRIPRDLSFTLWSACSL